MADIQIVGLGLSTIDILVRMNSMPTWERGGKMDELRLDGGGPVGTALVAASRLGVKTGFVGTRGNDEMGELKQHFLAQDGVDLSGLVTRPRPETQLVVVYVQSTTGERIFTFADNFGQDDLKLSELDQDYFTSAEYLHLDGCCQLDVSMAAIEWMHQAGKQVVIDAGKTNEPLSEKMTTLVKNCDYLICGSGFVESLTGQRGVREASMEALKMGPKVVVQTEGEDGCFTTSAAKCFHTPAFKIDAVDTTGAGDVFHGAYLVGLLKGWDLEKIAIFSSAVAALKCIRMGGRKGIPHFNDVIEFLKCRGNDPVQFQD